VTIYTIACWLIMLSVAAFLTLASALNPAVLPSNGRERFFAAIELLAWITTMLFASFNGSLLSVVFAGFCFSLSLWTYSKRYERSGNPRLAALQAKFDHLRRTTSKNLPKHRGS
jgi:hypothetical protein